MTLPAILWAHNHVTEREGAHIWPEGQRDDAAWEDCTFVGGLEFARLTIRPSIPATHYEAERLREESGEDPLGGTGTDDLVRGIQRRYGVYVPRVYSWTGLDAALQPGYAAGVAGSMGAFPDGHRLRRWDPGFASGHFVLVARVGDRYWWCDPLAPDTGYQGEWVTKAELKAFVLAWPGTHVVRQIIPEPIVPDTSTAGEIVAVNAVNGILSPYVVHLPAGTPLYDDAGLTVKRTNMSAEADVAYYGIIDADAIAVGVTTGGKPAILAAKRGPTPKYIGIPVETVEVVKEVIKEVPTGITQADLDAAVASAKAAATKAERERIALAEAARVRAL